MLKYVKGDLFQVKSGIIAHSVNCRGTFGRGVAGQIARLYPDVRTHYLKKYDEKGWNLGEVQFILMLNNESEFIFANVAGQDDYGTYKVQVDYEALEDGLATVFTFAEEMCLPVAMPKIGCGLAGGDWERVERIITSLLMEYDVDVTVYEL